MKKITFLIVLLGIAACSLCACSKANDAEKTDARKQLQQVITEVELPVKIDSTTTITSIELNDDELITHINIPASRLSLIKLDSLRQSQINRMNSDLSSRKLRKLVKQGDVSLHYIYTDGNQKLELKIRPEDL